MEKEHTNPAQRQAREQIEQLVTLVLEQIGARLSAAQPLPIDADSLFLGNVITLVELVARHFEEEERLERAHAQVRQSLRRAAR